MNFEHVKNYYEKVYEEKKDHSFPFDQQRYQSWLNPVAEFQDGKGKQSLDIGCGAGFVCRLLADKGFDVYGTDISETALKLAQTYVPTGHFQISESSGLLNFKDESFDVLTCLGVLEHIINPETVVQECCRVLKDGSKAVFVVPNAGSPYFWFGGGTSQIYEKPRSLKEWSRMFQAGGFKIQNVESDPGPTVHAHCSASKKIKVSMNRMIGQVIRPLAYQLVFVLMKEDAV
ncbi:MAG: class I SAM-dependent methyltransferase [Candidatus Omnitrophica bacterium]|nr:class I SAM-dependent methyltransferase [Candidatus Omnitrophota bacterium]